MAAHACGDGGYRVARSADRSTKVAHIVAPSDLSGIFWREAAAQHRRDELHPLRVVLQTAGSDLLVGADANMLYADDLNHFFQAVDLVFETREAASTHRSGTRKRGVRQEQGLGRDFDR